MVTPIRHAARVILINERRELLLIHVIEPNAFGLESSVCKEYWITPGGKIEAGESAEDAARRELYEETGIQNAQIRVPHIWYSETMLEYRGCQTLFKEWFFLAHTTETNISTVNYTEQEKIALGEHRWWTFDELKTTHELLFPVNIYALIAGIDNETE